MDQIQTWTWIQLAHTRPSSWQAVPWSVSNSFLSCPSFKANHWQYDGLFHHGISQWCYNIPVSEWECIELQGIQHQKIQPEQLLISIFTSESGPLILWEQRTQMCCPILSHLASGLGWILLPFPANASSDTFLSSLTSFILKNHYDLVPKFTCRYCPRLLIAVNLPPFSQPAQVFIYD